MSDMHYELESHGDTAAADLGACIKANEVLQRAYPGHPWLIGADHFAGVIHCRLMYEGQAAGNNGYGFLLYMSTIAGPDGERKLRAAGGECLERFNLARSAATDESAVRAMENGLDLGGIVKKSRN